MNEEVSNKTVNLAISTTKLSVTMLGRALIEYARRTDNRLKEISREKQVYTYKGKQTLKQLISQNQGVTKLDVSDGKISDFKRILNKYGVDFAITKDKEENGKTKYLVFFKARDIDAIEKAMGEYQAKEIRRDIKKDKHREKPERESVLKKLKMFKEMVKSTPKKEKRREIVR